MEKQSYRILIHGNNAVKSSQLFERLQLSYPDNNCIEMEHTRLEFYAYPDLNLFNRFQEPQIDANIISLIGHAGNSSDYESGISLFIILISQTEIFSRDMKRMITDIAQNKHFKSEKYFWDHATILFSFEDIVGNYPQEVERSINGNVGIKEVVEKAGNRYIWMSNSCTNDELGASILFQCKNVEDHGRLRYSRWLIFLIFLMLMLISVIIYPIFLLALPIILPPSPIESCSLNGIAAGYNRCTTTKHFI